MQILIDFKKIEKMALIAKKKNLLCATNKYRQRKWPIANVNKNDYLFTYLFDIVL